MARLLYYKRFFIQKTCENGESRMLILTGLVKITAQTNAPSFFQRIDN